MLNKCVNPQCHTPLRYLRDGKVIRVDGTKLAAAPKCGDQNPTSIDQRNAVREVEHFWLCGTCLKDHDVVFRPEMGICVLPKQKGAVFSKRGIDEGATSQQPHASKTRRNSPEAVLEPGTAAAAAA